MLQHNNTVNLQDSILVFERKCIIIRMNGCHHCVLLIVSDERQRMRIYSAPRTESLPKNSCCQQSNISLQYLQCLSRLVLQTVVCYNVQIQLSSSLWSAAVASWCCSIQLSTMIEAAWMIISNANSHSWKQARGVLCKEFSSRLVKCLN